MEAKASAVVGATAVNAAASRTRVARARTVSTAIVVVARAAIDGAEEAVRTRLRRDLPSFQQPARYVWVEEMPRNANGKLDRVAVRALAEGTVA